MELKRYVLLSDNSILTKEEFERQRKVDLFYADRLFVRHSDNILDLVEVGDLVESRLQKLIEFDLPIVCTVLENDLTSQILTVYGAHSHGIMIKENVKAIYKRQPNGDYKRYEVQR